MIENQNKKLSKIEYMSLFRNKKVPFITTENNQKEQHQEG